MPKKANNIIDHISKVMDEEQVFGLCKETIANRVRLTLKAIEIGFIQDDKPDINKIIKNIIAKGPDIPLDYSDMDTYDNEHPFLWEIDDRLHNLALRIGVNTDHVDFESIKLHLVKNGRMRQIESLEYAAIVKDNVLNELIVKFSSPKNKNIFLLKHIEAVCSQKSCSLSDYNIDAVIDNLYSNVEIEWTLHGWSLKASSIPNLNSILELCYQPGGMQNFVNKEQAVTA